MIGTVTLTPNSAPKGTTIAVKGTGAGRRLAVAVSLDGINVANVKSNTKGRFAASLVAAGANGPHTVSFYSESPKLIHTGLAVLTITAVVEPPPPPPVDPPPVEPPPPGQVIVQFPGSGSATAAAFAALVADLDTDIIEMAGRTYPNWVSFLGVQSIDGHNMDRGSSHPLLVRPAQGANVIFDGGGSSSPPFRIGWTSKASYITFEPAGTGGSFRAQNYRIGAAGLVMFKWYDHVAFNGLIVRDCGGTGTIQTSHALYLDSDLSHRGQYGKFKNWDIVGPPDRKLSGLHSYHEPSSDHVEVTGWRVRSLNRAAYVHADPTDVLIEGWEIDDCNGTIDSYGGATAQGVVKNCHARNSGPMKPGSGWWLNTRLVDGGGNTAS